jgi:phosphoribosylaminoimidazolecarboxamide formyltransferase/IMP cyclohydrolase
MEATPGNATPVNTNPVSQQRLALISVSDKTGIIEFASSLSKLGYALLSTGGTAKALAGAGLAVTEVSDYTGSPEIMGGRVKTLHPRIHGGLLGRAGEDDGVMSDEDIPRINLAVINLYPFESVTSQPDCSFGDAIENIDIGGPAMVRSAAKNFESVAIVTSPEQYQAVLEQLESGSGELDRKTRFELAVAAFNRVAQYDDAISNYLSALEEDGNQAAFPGQTNSCFVKVAELRYGENPHQQAAWYRDVQPAVGSLAAGRQHQGKELSYNKPPVPSSSMPTPAAWRWPRTRQAPMTSHSPLTPHPLSAESLRSTGRWMPRRRAASSIASSLNC